MNSNITLKVKLNNEDALAPTFGSKFAAGMDLYSCEDIIIPSHKTKAIDTGISVSWSGQDEENYYLRIAPRSGLALKSGIYNAGVIDYDYRGPIKVILFNFSDEHFIVKKHDKIAQLLLEKINRPTIELVDQLDDTERGANGFGSSGR